MEAVRIFSKLKDAFEFVMGMAREIFGLCPSGLHYLLIEEVSDREFNVWFGCSEVAKPYITVKANGIYDEVKDFDFISVEFTRDTVIITAYDIVRKDKHVEYRARSEITIPVSKDVQVSVFYTTSNIGVEIEGTNFSVRIELRKQS